MIADLAKRIERAAEEYIQHGTVRRSDPVIERASPRDVSLALEALRNADKIASAAILRSEAARW